MDSKIFKLIAITVMAAFLSGLASSSAIAAVTVGNPNYTPSTGIVSVTTSNVTISVTGGNNVPFYHIQTKDNTSYLVKFMDLEEFIDKNSNGIFESSEFVPLSTTAFPGSSWNFSGFNTTNSTANVIQMINFNFTHSTAPMIDLNNHINVTNGNEISFDIALHQYSWVSTNSSAKLAIKMQISGGNLNSGANSTSLNFGSAYFDAVSSATTPNGTIAVTTQIVNDNTFYLIFDHFVGNFTLDPVFGVTSTSNTNTGSSSTSLNTTSQSTPKTTGLELLPILGGLAVISLVYSKKHLR